MGRCKRGNHRAINGLILGSMIGVAAWIWKQNPWLGLVVGVSMTINTIIAVVRWRIDATDPKAIQAGSRIGGWTDSHYAYRYDGLFAGLKLCKRRLALLATVNYRHSMRAKITLAPNHPSRQLDE